MKRRYALTLAALILGLILALSLTWYPRIAAASGISGRDNLRGAEAFRLYHHSFLNNYYDHTSTLYLQNPTIQSANVILTLEDLQSDDAYAFVRTIPARGTAAISAESLAGLPDGRYCSLVVESDQPVHSVVRIRRASPTGDLLGSYRGISATSTDFHLGPFHKAWATSIGAVESAAILWNVGDTSASVNLDFIDFSGSVVATATTELDSGQQWTVLSMTQDQLPDGFRGWARITADQGILGWLQQFGGSNDVFQIYGPLDHHVAEGTPVYEAHLPRALKGLDEGGGPRTTHFFVGNTGSTEATAILSYYNADGTVVHESDLTLPPAGATVIDLGAEHELLDEDIWAVILSGDQPVLLGEVYYDESARVSVGAYRSLASHELNLPRLSATNHAPTVFSVQSLESTGAFVSIDYYDLAGTLAFTEELTLPPGGWVRRDQSQMPQLDDGFVGSAVIESSGNVVAEVDEYLLPLTLDVITAGQGHVDVEPERDAYVHGEAVTLTATADPGWTFGAWSGDVESSDNPLALTVTEHTAIVATFCHSADVNCDGLVDIIDVQLTASAWRCTQGTSCYLPRCDVDGDGIITVLDIMTVVAAWGSTEEVLDQAQTGTNYGFFFDDNLVRWQEFIPSLRNVTAVEVYVGRSGNPGDVIVELRTASGETLAQTTVQQADIPAGGGWIRTSLDTPLSLAAGTTYRIAVYASQDSPSPDNRYFWRGSTESTYRSDCQTDVSGVWPDYDYAFKTFGLSP